jgi:CubicO group peptidase (beta-lactamase class C family)
MITAPANAFAAQQPAAQSQERLTGAALSQSLSQAATRLDDAGFDGHVSLSVDGEIVFAASLGPADPVNGVPYSLLTQTDIGSIAKTLTGLVASRLISDGRLDPQSTLADWFENVPDDKAGITLHQLMTHSAGLPPAIGDDHDPIDRETYVEQALAADLMFTPGSAYAYSNVGFSLMAVIIETVTGESYDSQLVATLETLGLVDTGYGPALVPSRGVVNSRGHSVTDASWGGETAHWHLIGNGGMLSTPLDLQRLGAAVINPPAGWAEAFDVQLQPYMPEGEGAASDYGYGVVVEDHPLFGRIYWHNGGNAYFANHWRVMPEQGVVMFVTSNTRSVDPDVAVDVLSAALFGRELEIVSRPVIDFGDPIALPNTAAGALAQAFLNAIASDQADDWQRFIETRTSPEFQAFAPMDRHLGMFRSLHQDLAGVEVYSVDTSDDEISFVAGHGDGVLLRVVIGHEDGSGGKPVMNGLSIDGL